MAEKQNDLARELGSSGVDDQDGTRFDKKDEEQIALYARRGISIAAYEKNLALPYFINLGTLHFNSFIVIYCIHLPYLCTCTYVLTDEDPFRSNRFLYVLRQEVTTFGNKGDVQLMSLAVLKDHCHVRVEGAEYCVYVKPDKGEVWHNGNLLPPDVESRVDIFDRIVVGDQLMLLRWPGREEEVEIACMTGTEAVEEFQEGLVNHRNKHTGSSSSPDISDAEKQALEEERKRIREERDKWEQEKSQFQEQRNEEDYQRMMTSVDNTILDLLPKAKEAKTIVDLFNRVTMNFDVVLEKGAVDHIPRVKVSVTNSNPKLSILIEPQEFLPKLSLLKDEMVKIRTAIEEEQFYELPERHDPLYLMFDNDFLLGPSFSP